MHRYQILSFKGQNQERTTDLFEGRPHERPHPSFSDPITYAARNSYRTKEGTYSCSNDEESNGIRR
jgi:hypothetical protein